MSSSKTYQAIQRAIHREMDRTVLETYRRMNTEWGKVPEPVTDAELDSFIERRDAAESYERDHPWSAVPSSAGCTARPYTGRCKR